MRGAPVRLKEQVAVHAPAGDDEADDLQQAAKGRQPIDATLSLLCSCQGAKASGSPVGLKKQVAVDEPPGDNQADDLQQAADDGQPVDSIHQPTCGPKRNERAHTDRDGCRLLLDAVPPVLRTQVDASSVQI